MFEAMIPPAWAAKILAMSGQEFWLAFGFSLLLAAAAFYFAFRFVFRARLMEDTPTSLIRSAAQGYVELDGTAELMKGDIIVAPLTGRRCTWYRYKVEERSDNDYHNSRRNIWHVIDSGVSDSLFLLVDGTGECVIDPEGAEVTPSDNQVWYGEQAVWRGGVPQRGRFGIVISSGRYRFREEVILPADPLYAIGQFSTVGGSQELPNTREEVAALLRHWKKLPIKMKEFDLDGNGIIDDEEWEAVRKAAHREVLKEQRERFGNDTVHMMGKPADGRRPYILSVHPQDGLVRRFRIYAALALSVFFIGGAAASWLFAVRF